MKNIITILFLLSSFVIFSQEKTTDEILRVNKHELSIFTENFLERNNIYYDTYYYPYYEQYINGLEPTQIGIGYRFHFKKSAIRMRVSLGTNKSSHDNGDGYKYEYSTFGLKSALGYEFHYNRGKAQLFYGADLNINLNNSVSKTENQNLTSENESNNKAIGISPLLGFKYHITPAISISTEIRVNIESYKVEYKSSSSNSIEDDFTAQKGLKTNIGPKGFISLNFHL